MATDAGSGATEQLLSAWQDGWQALFGGYRRQISALGTGAQTTPTERQPVRRAFERIAAGTQALTLAQLDLAAEWLRLPLALTLPANTSGLAASYGRLIEAYGELLSAYLSAAAPVQAFTLRVGARAGETAEKLVEAQVETARRTTAAGDLASRAAIEATATAVEQAAEVAERASDGAQASVDRRIKGNINAHGEKIYHLPGQSSYERTQAEEWFSSEEAAQTAGYRRAETPGGGAVKGKITREGERIYHLPGQANYDRVEPDMLFETEEQARAAGFRPSQR